MNITIIFTMKRGSIMFSKTKRAAILVAASALLATSLGGNIVYADTTSSDVSTTASATGTSNTNVATATNDNSDSSNQVVSANSASTTTKSNDSSTSNSATTQSSFSSIDVAAVKAAMLS